jgi:hypothetical protein
MEKRGSDGLKIGDFLIIKKDVYLGYLGKNYNFLESLIGKVLPVLSVDKPNNKITLDVPGSLPLEIPFKDWKDIAVKFDKVKKLVGWRGMFGIPGKSS